MDERLKDLTNEQLMDAIVNFKKYGYSEEIRADALRTLETRKIPKAKLDRLAERFVSEKRKVEYDKRELIAISKRYALFAGILLSVYLLAIVFSPILWLVFMLISGERADFMLLLSSGSSPRPGRTRFTLSR